MTSALRELRTPDEGGDKRNWQDWQRDIDPTTRRVLGSGGVGSLFPDFQWGGDNGVGARPMRSGGARTALNGAGLPPTGFVSVDVRTGPVYDEETGTYSMN